jgi:hypothetical protein
MNTHPRRSERKHTREDDPRQRSLTPIDAALAPPHGRDYRTKGMSRPCGMSVAGGLVRSSGAIQSMDRLHACGPLAQW